MLQHLALLLVGPGLLALDRPWARVASLLPRARGMLDSASDALRRPGMSGAVILVAAGFHAVVVSAWHATAAYDAAVASAPLHIVEHATFIAAGWATWVAARAAATMEPAAAIAGLFLVAAQGAALGAILTFAGTPLYESTAADALADQQLAGLILWVPGGAPYSAAAARWYGRPSRRDIVGRTLYNLEG